MNDEFEKHFKNLYDNLTSQYSDMDEEEGFISSEDIVKMKHPPERVDGEIITERVDDKEMEEVFHYHRYNVGKEHVYTEQELEEIKKSCMNTLVHDYSMNDEYHLTDEERMKNDNLKELSVKLAKLKTIYRQVDQYIVAMRTVMEAWKILEEKENVLFSEPEFYKMIREGKISHPRVPLPKLKNMDKYNLDLIITYISNPELDPEDLVPKQQPKYDPWAEDEDDETEEDKMNRLLDDNELQFIIDNADNPPEFEVLPMKEKYIRGYKKTLFSKKKKKGSKVDRRIQKDVHALLNKIQSDPNNFRGSGSTRSYLMTNDLFTPKEKDDSFWDDVRFHGDWSNKYDVELYNILERLKLSELPCPGKSYTSYADQEVNKFFMIMEANGINTIELRQKLSKGIYINDVVESNKRKENKKLEARIVQRITKLNNNSKFKKLVAKAEKGLANSDEDDYDDDDD